MEPARKPLFWVGNSLEDLRAFPDEVKQVVGFALHVAQSGGKHPDAKPLKGFGGAGVLEIVEDFDGSAFRAVYTVRFTDAVYVLHAFQKKSRRGIQTPSGDMERVRVRLRLAEEDHSRRRDASKGKE